jgi:hypothetical protein
MAAICGWAGNAYLHRQKFSAFGDAMAIRRADEERLPRVRRDRAGRRLVDDLMEIGARCAVLPDLDTRSAEEILGYDENGLPHSIMATVCKRSKTPGY